MPTKDDTNGMHIRPGREMINRLHALSIKCKRESANMVAVQIIKDCVEIWSKGEQAKRDILQSEEARLDALIKGNSLRQPLLGQSAEAESELKPQARNKRGSK